MPLCAYHILHSHLSHKHDKWILTLYVTGGCCQISVVSECYGSPESLQIYIEKLYNLNYMQIIPPIKSIFELWIQKVRVLYKTFTVLLVFWCVSFKDYGILKWKVFNIAGWKTIRRIRICDALFSLFFYWFVK